MYRAQAISGPPASSDSDACFCCFADVNSPTECTIIDMHFIHFHLVCHFSCPTMCSLQKQNLQPLSTFFPHLHIFHLNSVFNNKYLFLLVISKYFTCFGSLIGISVAQQLDLTAILKLQTSETSVLLAQRQGILSSRNRSWCSASVSVRWYYTGTDCDPENIRHLLLA